MTLPYDINIPFATNSPSDDQSKMQQNTNSISTLVAQDHYGFNNQFNLNANSGGWHTRIHMVDQGAAFDPAQVTDVGQLYSKTVTFNTRTDQALFYRSGTTLSAGNSLTQITAPRGTVLAATGFAFLPGKLLMQWGVDAVSGSITYSPAFAAAAYSIQLTPRGTGAAGARMALYVVGSNSAGFTYSISTNADVTITSVYWVAIGEAVIT